jgi:hypothetical protein
MRFDDAAAAADALNRQRNRQREGLRPFRAEVTSVDAGLISLQRSGATVDEDAGYPILIPGAVETGDEIVALDLGGAPIVLGKLGPQTTPMVGQVFARHSSASAATTTTNTSTSTYVTARSETWSDIPDGTYDVLIDFSAAYSHSSSGSVHNRLTVGSTTDSELSLSLTTARETLRYTRSFSNVVVSGGLTVTLEYKLNGGSGTISARNPAIFAALTYKGA